MMQSAMESQSSKFLPRAAPDVGQKDTVQATTGQPQKLASGDSLTLILTVESLLFAVFAAAIGLSSVTSTPRRLLPEAKSLSVWAALVLTFLSASALVAWWYVFVDDGSWSVSALAGAAGLAVGIVALPAFAWSIARALRR